MPKIEERIFHYEANGDRGAGRTEWRFNSEDYREFVEHSLTWPPYILAYPFIDTQIPNPDIDPPGLIYNFGQRVFIYPPPDERELNFTDDVQSGKFETGLLDTLPKGIKRVYAPLAQQFATLVQQEIANIDQGVSSYPDHIVDLVLWGDIHAIKAVTTLLPEMLKEVTGANRSSLAIQRWLMNNFGGLRLGKKGEDTLYRRRIAELPKQERTPIALVVLDNASSLVSSMIKNFGLLNEKDHWQFVEDRQTLIKDLIELSNLDKDPVSLTFIETCPVSTGLPSPDANLAIGIPDTQNPNLKDTKKVFVGVPAMSDEQMKEAFIYPKWQNTAYQNLAVTIAGQSLEMHKLFADTTAILCQEGNSFLEAISSGDSLDTEIRNSLLKSFILNLVGNHWEDRAKYIDKDELMQRLLIIAPMADSKTGALMRGWDKVAMQDLGARNVNTNITLGTNQETDTRVLGREWLDLLIPPQRMRILNYMHMQDNWLTIKQILARYKQIKEKIAINISNNDEVTKTLTDEVLIQYLDISLVRALQILGDNYTPKPEIKKNNPFPENAVPVCAACGTQYSNNEVVRFLGAYQYKEQGGKCSHCGFGQIAIARQEQGATMFDNGLS